MKIFTFRFLSLLVSINNIITKLRRNGEVDGNTGKIFFLKLLNKHSNYLGWSPAHIIARPRDSVIETLFAIRGEPEKVHLLKLAGYNGQGFIDHHFVLSSDFSVKVKLEHFVSFPPIFLFIIPWQRFAL